MSSAQDGMEGLTALMSIIANPKIAQEHFEKLAAQVKAIQDQADEAAKQSYADLAVSTAARKAAADERQTAEATLEAHRIEVAQFRKEKADHQQKMELQKQKLANEREVLDRSRQDFTRTAISIADREVAVKRAEDAIAGHEQTAAANAQITAKARVDAEVLKAQYEERIAALHKAMA
jgi:hypothetical protein